MPARSWRRGSRRFEVRRHLTAELAAEDERGHPPGGARPSRGAADAADVLDAVAREVEQEDMAHLVKVHASGGAVGAHEYPRRRVGASALLGEALQRALALLGGDGTVEGVDLEATPALVASTKEVLDAAARLDRVAEDEAALRGLRFELANHHRRLEVKPRVAVAPGRQVRMGPLNVCEWVGL